MITGLLGWFAGKETNKRRYPRKRKPYPALYVLDDEPTERPAIGLDISAGGCSFLSQKLIAAKEFDLLLQLADRRIRVRARAVREDPGLHLGSRVYRYGMQFTGIAADDWDAIVRFTTDQTVAEPRSQIVEDLQRVRMTPDEQARLLPLALQNKLLAMLVHRGRLAPLDEKVNPLVQFFYTGLVRQEKGLLHRMAIQSKYVLPDGSSTLFETLFLFDDAGANISIIEGQSQPKESAAG